jgi:hypothetical protein
MKSGQRIIFVKAAIALTLASLLAAPPALAKKPQRWSKQIDVELSARQLDLRSNAAPRRLAHAAVERFAPRLGLSRSTKGLRLARSFGIPPVEGSQPVTIFTFNQTAGGLRLLWSEVDVTVAGDTVSAISSTVVPARPKLAGRRKVSRSKALAIARRAVAGEELAQPAEAIAYAGNPELGRAKPRTPRRAWVVRVDLPSTSGGEPTGLCVVVDAQTGKVLAKWEGTAARDQTPKSGAGGARASATSTGLNLYTSISASQNQFYARFTLRGDPRVSSNWPSLDQGLYSGTRTQLRDTLTFNALNVIRTICVVRNYCGKRGVFNGSVVPWEIVLNSHNQQSGASPGSLLISIGTDDASTFNGANDVIAHEVGHIQDLVYAGDRQQGLQHTKEVQEGLADMFAFDYDRFDPIFKEDMVPGGVRRWDNPTALSENGRFYPAVASQYFCGPRSPHLNSTIISHAFFKLSVQPAVGINRAGAILQHVPAFFGPRPTFPDVTKAFIQLSGDLYPQDDGDAGTVPEAREAAQSAFGLVGQGPFGCGAVPTFPSAARGG